jgi:outer membrane lipoprotein-sorting protein
MCRRILAALAAAMAASAFATDRGAPPVAELTAAQIVDRNVAARGGLEAWRKVQTMVWTGHLESLHAPVPSMLFMMQQKRPNKSRFEIHALGEKTVRAFDGERGWKVKPDEQGRPQVKPFSSEETAYERGAQLIDGPLIDYQAKGNSVTLESLDEIEGRKAYRLAVRLRSGETDRLWVDAQTFLDVRYDRASLSGRSSVSVFYREYKPVDGLQIPFVIETGTAPGAKPDRMVIERVMLNAPVDDHAFARPATRGRGGMVIDNTPRQATRPMPMNVPDPRAPDALPSAPPSAAAPGAASGPN